MPHIIIKHAVLGEMVTAQKHCFSSIVASPVGKDTAIRVQGIANMRVFYFVFKCMKFGVNAFQGGTA